LVQWGHSASTRTMSLVSEEGKAIAECNLRPYSPTRTTSGDASNSLRSSFPTAPVPPKMRADWPVIVLAKGFGES
jgi:hypothetical protein